MKGLTLELFTEYTKMEILEVDPGKYDFTVLIKGLQQVDFLFDIRTNLINANIQIVFLDITKFKDFYGNFL